MKDKKILKYEETNKYKDAEILYQVEFSYQDNSETFITLMTKFQLEKCLGYNIQKKKQEEEEETKKREEKERRRYRKIEKEWEKKEERANFVEKEYEKRCSSFKGRSDLWTRDEIELVYEEFKDNCLTKKEDKRKIFETSLSLERTHSAITWMRSHIFSEREDLHRGEEVIKFREEKRL